MASDATFVWNGGTGAASSPSNWTLQTGGTPNTPNIPQSDDSIVIASGDAQFTDMPVPGQDNGTQGGVVTMTGGEIDMINSGSAGGFAGILSNTFVQLTNTVATVGSITSSGIATNSGTIDADANGTMTLAVMTGTLSNLGTIEAINGGTLIIATGTGSQFNNDGGTALVNGGSILLTGALGGSAGYWALNGGQIEVHTSVASANTSFDFVGAGTLKIDQLSSFQGDILEPGTGDFVDIGHATVGTVVVASAAGSPGEVNVTLEDGTGNPLGSFFVTPFSGDVFQTGTFAVAGDGTAGPNFAFSGGGGSDALVAIQTSPVACFMAGTRIATEQGEVAVEDLQVGDRVTTAIGGKAEAVIWIGHRTIDCSRHPQPKQVWPVRISAGAFGRGKPSSDLWLSPDHAVYVEDVLIPVKHLINGSSIVQVPRVSVTYYHVELRQHDVLLANGLTAESYLAGANRSVFVNSGGAVDLHPDLSSRVWEAEGCAPLVVTGPALEAAKQRVKLPGRAKPARRRAKAA